MNPYTIIAIDPGASGGIAVKYPHALADAIAMPDTQGDVLGFIRDVDTAATVERWPKVAVIEKVGGYVRGNAAPGSAMFGFGRGVGFAEGALMALGWRLIEVPPQKWQKHFSLGTAASCASKTEWKNKLKAEAQRRFPHMKVTLSTADALLILDYATAQTL